MKDWIFAALAALGLLMLSISLASCTNQQGNVSSTRQDFELAPVAKEAFDLELRAACGDGGVDDSAQFLRLPYLQKTTSEGTEILWTSDAADAIEVVITTPDGSEVATVPSIVDESTDRPEFTQYVAGVHGLSPAQIYCYEIRGENGTWLAKTGFRTAPEPGSGDRVRIVALGDLGSQTGDQFAVLEQIQNVPYDLALVAGDLAYEKGTLSDHENNFFAVYSEVLRNIPFFVISGNHDYASDGGIFREVFALFENGGPSGVERWYSFDWGDVHIVALDTEKVDEVQAAWLEEDLATNSQPWTIVFLHRPAFSSGSHGSTGSVQTHFVPLFARYGVDLVLAGHDHDYERTKAIDDVTYVVTGSGGRGTRPVGSSSFTEYSEAVAHFSYIVIEGNQLRLNAIDGSGRDFDAVTITH